MNMDCRRADRHSALQSYSREFEGATLCAHAAGASCLRMPRNATRSWPAPLPDAPRRPCADAEQSQDAGNRKLRTVPFVEPLRSICSRFTPAFQKAENVVERHRTRT
eukprot:GHVU01154354.1.p1 GENE.GHVU01154354.1~~GHVU01154354.1.p1  ORF type:complete len:107 (-),score=0.78 GHVU01154354.1:279-599(-)